MKPINGEFVNYISVLERTIFKKKISVYYFQEGFYH